VRALAFAWLLLLAAPACSSFVCDATTCASGCCEGGSCYQGMNLSGGVSCDTVPVGGGGGNSSFGGGGGGSGGSGGGGGASCGNYDDPCNASLVCCVSSEQNTLTNFCNSAKERCDLCGTYLYDCSDDMTICCPGLDCLLKPGFSTVYECQ